VELTYKLKIENPSRHLLKVEIEGKRPKGSNQLLFYLPRWCQGHYQGKNYDPFIRTFCAQNKQGEYLFFEKVKDAMFELDWDQSELKGDREHFVVSYQIYCHHKELDHASIDESHAYLFGANCFMGIAGQNLKNLKVNIEFPPLWSRINTSLEDISKKLDIFSYKAKNYSELINTPIEIGCHETDGFRIDGIDHYLCQIGDLFPHGKDIKKDLITVVGEVRKIFPHIKIDKFNIINNFNSGFFSGAGLPSTTLMNLHGIKLADDNYYLKFLYKFCGQYIGSHLNHLIPDDLNNSSLYEEAHSKILWVIEGLTNFLPGLFLFRAGIINETTFVQILENLIDDYLENNGKKFQNLLESSQNLWTRVSDISEDHNNFQVPASLKGAIVFFFLSAKLFEKGSSLSLLVSKLSKNKYLKQSDLTDLVTSLTGPSVNEEFELLFSTTEDIDITAIAKIVGIKYITHESGGRAWLGLIGQFLGERVFIKSLALDGPGYKGGLNIGDELLAINGKRILKNSFTKISRYLMIDKYYQFLIRRGERILEAEILVEKSPINFKALEIEDRKILMNYLRGI